MILKFMVNFFDYRKYFTIRKKEFFNSIGQESRQAWWIFVLRN